MLKRLNVLYCHGLGSSVNCRHATQLQAFFDRKQHKDVYFERFHYKNPGSLDHVWNINEWRRDIEERISVNVGEKWVLMATSGASHAALNIAKTRPETVHGLFLMCPGTSLGLDFVETIRPGTLQYLLKTGKIEYPPSKHGHPALLDLACLEEFVRTDICSSEGPIDISCPVLTVHGEADNIVPIGNSVELMKRIKSGYKELIRLPDADHYFDLDEPILKSVDDLMNVIRRTEHVAETKTKKANL